MSLKILISIILLGMSILTHSFDMNNVQRIKTNFSLNYHLSSAHVQTSQSTQTIESTQSLSVYSIRPMIDYFYNRSFVLSASYFLPFGISSAIESSGYSLGAKYYFLGSGYNFKGDVLGKSIQTNALWAANISLAYIYKDFKFSNTSINFSGFLAEVTGEYHFRQDYFASVNIGLERTNNNQVRSLSAIGLSLGLGISL